MRALYLTMLLAILLAGMITPVRAQPEAEPNDTIEQASPIAVGYANAVINAEIHSVDDVDFYRFTAQAGRTYVFDVFNVQQTTSWSYPELFLYDTTGKRELADARFGASASGDALLRIVYTVFTDGNHYLKVTSGSDEVWTGAYSLRILAKYDEPGAGWDAANDMEPNDVWQLATVLEVGAEKAQTHMITPRNPSYEEYRPDQDWYRFEAVAGVPYAIETFDVIRDKFYGSGIELYGANKETPLAEDEDGKYHVGKVNAQIIYTFPIGGEYFIRVRPAGYDLWRGTYSIRICEVTCWQRVYVPFAQR